MGEIIKSNAEKGRAINRSLTQKVGPLQIDPPATPFSGSASFSEHAWSEVSRTLGLSGRELQIVHGMFNDKIQYAIAADLGISPHTVHTHIERLYHKLEVSNRAQLLVRVMTVFVALAASSRISPPAVSAMRAPQR